MMRWFPARYYTTFQRTTALATNLSGDGPSPGRAGQQAGLPGCAAVALQVKQPLDDQLVMAFPLAHRPSQQREITQRIGMIAAALPKVFDELLLTLQATIACQQVPLRSRQSEPLPLQLIGECGGECALTHRQPLACFNYTSGRGEPR